MLLGNFCRYEFREPRADYGVHENLRIECALRAGAIRDAIYKAFYEALLEEGKGEEEAHETACYLIGEIDDETKE